MFAILDTENATTMYWEEVVTSSQTFTAATQSTVAKRRTLPTWSAMPNMAIYRVNDANDDIVAGRVKTFSTAEEMLNDLHRM